MGHHLFARRRSPGWVRALDSRTIHGIALSLRREQETADLSRQQVWLFDGCISELEYRHRCAVRGDRLFGRPCMCELCVAGPFDYERS